MLKPCILAVVWVGAGLARRAGGGLRVGGGRSVLVGCRLRRISRDLLGSSWMAGVAGLQSRASGVGLDHLLRLTRYILGGPCHRGVVCGC